MMPSTTIFSLVALVSLCVITASDATNGTATKVLIPPNYDFVSSKTNIIALTMQHMLSKLEGELFGARCLDGSNYGTLQPIQHAGSRLTPIMVHTSTGFYISTNTSSTKWVIYMQGGGYCATKSDCDARAKTVRKRHRTRHVSPTHPTHRAWVLPSTGEMITHCMVSPATMASRTQTFTHGTKSSYCTGTSIDAHKTLSSNIHMVHHPPCPPLSTAPVTFTLARSA